MACLLKVYVLAASSGVSKVRLSRGTNQSNEPLREQIEQLQLIKLKRMCDYAYANVPFHKRQWEAAGFHPDHLKSLEDMRRREAATYRELEASGRFSMSRVEDDG